jgi:D-glycero-D-manno-heptose 1,7-bisphosphate phosphatase
MTNLLLLDLDGTIREPKSGSKFINRPDDQQLIPGAIRAMEAYRDDGYAMVGITNQGGVPRFKSLGDCLNEQQRTMELCKAADVPLRNIFFAPGDGRELHSATAHHRAVTITPMYRKPAPGMIFAAISAYGGTDGDILYVGDRPEDEAAVAAANESFDPAVAIRFIWARDWWPY